MSEQKNRRARAYELTSHWSFWVGIAYFGLALTVTWLYFVNSRTLQQQAIRTAELRATKSAAVERCLTSRPQLRRVSRFVKGVNEFALVIVQNSGRTLEQTPVSDPEYAIRKANLRRLIIARENIGSVKGFHVPSVRECKSLGR